MRVALAMFAVLAIGGSVAAQGPSLADQRARLTEAKRAAAAAAARATDLGEQAARERSAADRARAKEAALGAKVTAAQAEVDAAVAQTALVDRLLADQRAALARQQAPVARLLAALQSLARRPTIVAIAQPGSVDDLVHVRAVLGGAMPLVRAQTVAVRENIDRTRALRASALTAAAALHDSRAALEANRVAIASLAAGHRRRSQALGASAIGESDRALALGERARDLVDTMGEQANAAVTAASLAALPGPVPRPLAPGVVPPLPPRGAYRLPVSGRLVIGLDEISEAGVRSRGLTFAVSPGAAVVAPAGGIVRFARSFRSYGRIVVIDHGGGWTSLITGLDQTMPRVGATVAMGDPIGTAARGDDPRITVELRRRGRPMDIPPLIG